MLNVDDIAHVEPRRLTRAEYDRFIALGFFQREHIELIHGMLVKMSPVGIRHRNAIDRLNELLLPRLLGRARVSIQQPFVGLNESEPEPDVSILPPGHLEDHPDRALLIIEVSESSLAYDRETKGPLYAASGVPEYWIVNLIDRRVEIHTQPRSGRYTSIEAAPEGSTLAPRAFPDVQIDVADLLR